MKCPRCGKRMRKEKTLVTKDQTVLRLIEGEPIGGEPITHVIMEWTCNPCDVYKKKS